MLMMLMTMIMLTTDNNDQGHV